MSRPLTGVLRRIDARLVGSIEEVVNSTRGQFVVQKLTPAWRFWVGLKLPPVVPPALIRWRARSFGCFLWIEASLFLVS
jgi:hypothetical protein